MLGNAPHSPTRRGVAEVARRIERLADYESWRKIEPVDFEQMLGPEDYAAYWKMLDQTIEGLRACQAVADKLKRRIAEAHARGPQRNG